MSIITLDLVGPQDQEGTLQVNIVPTVNTIAGIQAVLDAFLTAWPGVSDAGVLSANLSYPLTVTPVAAKAAANLDEAARVRLAMATGIGKENYRIPAPVKDVNGVFTYIAEGKVDVTDGGIVAFFDLFETTGSIRIGKNANRAVAQILSGYLERK